MRIAVPITKPLSTSQKAEDEKPEKITSGAASRRIVAAAKNSSAVRNSGRRAKAHSPIVAAASRAGNTRPPAIVMSIAEPSRHLVGGSVRSGRVEEKT